MNRDGQVASNEQCLCYKESCKNMYLAFTTSLYPTVLQIVFIHWVDIKIATDHSGLPLKIFKIHHYNFKLDLSLICICYLFFFYFKIVGRDI